MKKETKKILKKAVDYPNGTLSPSEIINSIIISIRIVILTTLSTVFIKKLM